MLFLLFRLGEDRYALEASVVTELLPLARLRRIPQAPAAVAGLLDLRGTPVPVIDLSQLVLGRPAHAVMSTRIILVRHGRRRGPESEAGASGGRHLIGLIAENATETMRRDPTDFVDPGLPSGNVPYLGRFARDAHGLVQWIEIETLLTHGGRDVLLLGEKAQ